MLGKFSYFLCFINIVSFICCESIYTVSGPGSIRSFSKYNVAVSIYKAESETPCEIEVGISSTKYNITKFIKVQPMSTENVEFEIPELERDDYKLTVKGVSGIKFENSTELIYVEYKPLILMQTDKAIYKPGDLVRFRILFLDEYTHAAELSQPKMIIIKNSNNDRIKIWKNVNLTQGVYTDSLQLSEQTALGTWTIEAYVDGNNFEKKTFDVDKYELPKFQINIETANNVAVNDEYIKVTVRSKYTFGKPVKGKATISISNAAVNEQVGIKKTVAINGKTQVEFNINQELLNANMGNDWISATYRISADVVEELTENKQSDTIYIVLHEKNVMLKAVQQPHSFYPGEPISLTVGVKKVDGSPIRDNKNPIQLHVNNLTYASKLNENGLATFRFTYPSAAILKVQCSYLDVHETFGNILPTNDDNPLQLILSTRKQKVGQDVMIKIKSKEPINYFTYTVTARGNIVKAATVEMPDGNSKSYTLKFSPTYEMIPKATILVQYIYNNNLRFKEESIEFEEQFQNSLKISSTSRAKPGDDIQFQISTDPNSFVGLLGVDQSVLILKEGNDLNKDDIYNSLQKYVSHAPTIASASGNRYPGKMSGLFMLTNAYYPFSREFIEHKLYDFKQGLNRRLIYQSPLPFSSSSSVAKKRKDFEESWIFEDLQTANQTSINFTKKIPDTLTSWVITGFSLNSKTGIALAQSPKVIKVFKSFFISVYLPYAVKQGEIISIPVLIFNYMNKTLDTEIIMYNSDHEFEFTEATNDVEERSIADTLRSKCITISANSVGSVSFMIRPKIIGSITLKINALTATAGDGVQQSLKVEPEGVAQYENRAFFINLNGEQEYSETITIDIPENAVPNSEHIEFSAIGDLVGLSIKNIENLVRLPFGYGEENIINFIPSILVLEYLQTIKQSFPNVTENALHILKLGFQSELKFKLNDGSFATSEWDSSGSTWLTAYIVRALQQASKFIYIDPVLITRALDFLATKQTTNGNFAEFGQLVNTSYSNDVAFSGFVLLAFLEHKNNDNSTIYRSIIEKGVRFLLQSLDTTDDTQSLSIIALVLQEDNHALADEVLLKLNAVANRENGYIWWSNDSKNYKRDVPNSSDIEITSYILQAMLEKGYSADVLPIIKWLIMKRNSNGGFASTRDTVVGLQALIKFAKMTGLSQLGTMNIDYICEGNEVEDKGKITIDSDNYMVLHTHKLAKNTRKIKFTAKGNTSSLLQLSYQYNIFSKKPQPRFSLNLSIREDTPPKKLIIDICAEFIPTNIEVEGNTTNLVVMEVTFPSGYTTNREELDHLRDFKTILFTETKKLDSIAVIYFKSLTANNTKCISINATRTHDVAKQKPVPVVIYEYYDKERSATEYYEIITSLCDICEGDECGDVCKKNKGFSNVQANNTCSSSN